MKKYKKIISIVILTTILIMFSGCNNIIQKESKKDNNINVEESTDNPVATMVVEYVNEEGKLSEGTIKIELYPQKAPITVSNFINLVNNGFYNNLTFHRIIDNFMIQGGDPKGNGSGGANLSDLNKNVQKGSDEDYEYSIKGEFDVNNYNNDVLFEEGTVAMARADYSSMGMPEEGYNSGSTQFFIMNTDQKSVNNSLQGQYAAFGKVIDGYDVVLDISKTEVTANPSTNEVSKPKSAPVIKSLTVETHGVEFQIPEVINADETKAKIQKRYMELIAQNYSN